MILSAFRLLTRAVIAIALALLIFAALIASLGRNFIPYVSDYRPQIVDWLNVQLPFPLAANAMNGDWSRLSPSIDVRELTLGNGEQALRLDRAVVQLNLAYSLWYRKLVFDQLQFAGVELTLSENAEGAWRLEADWLPKVRTQSSLISAEALYVGLDHLLIRGAKLNLKRHNGRLISIDHLNLQFNKQGNQWRVTTDGLPDKSALPINVIAEGTGLPSHNDFAARAYTLINGFEVSPYLQQLSYRGWTPELPRFDGQLWLDFSHAGGMELQGVVDVKDIHFTHNDGKQDIDVPELKTQFKFALSEQGTPSVWLRQLQLQLKDENIAFEHANLLPTDEGLQASFDSIALSPVLRLLRRFDILPEAAQQVLTSLDPSGVLHDIRLTIPKGGDLSGVRVAAGLDDLGLRAWKGAPGVENLSGHVFAGARSGLVEIDSRNLALKFPMVYRQAISFADVSGPVRWSIGERSVDVRSGALSLQGKPGKASAFVALDLPLKKDYGLTPQMELQVALHDSKAQYRDMFIPYKLNEQLREWLQRSIVKADIAEAGFIYRGSIAKAPGLERTTQLYINATGAEVDYDPAWPAARKLTAMVFIDDSDVLVEAERAELSGLQLQDATVRYVRHPSEPGGQIKLQSKLKGAVSSALEFLVDSPVRQNLGGALDDWYAQGDINGSVKASIPIGLKIKESVDVRTRLSGAQLGNDKVNLLFEDINGPLRYSSKKGLHSKRLVGTLWSDSWSATIRSAQLPPRESVAQAEADIEVEPQPEWETTVAFEGVSRGEAVLDWLRRPLHDFVDGEFDYQAALKIRGGDSQLSINTDLAGLTSTLPKPLDKASHAQLPLGLRLYLNEDPLRLRIQLADRLRSALVLHSDKPMTGMISFGTDQQPSYVDDSIRLLGVIPEFELERTLDVIQALAQHQPNTGAIEAQQQPMVVYAQDLVIQTADVFGNEFRDLTAAVASHGDAWTFAFDSAGLAGRASYDASQSTALNISLDRLYLQTETDQLGLQQAAQDEEVADLDLLADWYPADIPEMQFQLADLRVNDNEYGRWGFASSSIQHGVMLSNLNADTRGLQIAGSNEQPAFLRWRRVGDQQQTEFRGVISCADLGAVLEAWEYAPAIRSKSCRFASDLSWYGSPLGLDLAQTEGAVDIMLSNGQFLETNSTANALRIFSLFNFDTLLRRLQFRFDDVFNRGLSYDQITGEFALANGRLDIESPFDVKGPSSRLQMTGSLDLVNETVDTKMVATLPISSNLPWVAALAGGLPMAAGVYVAGKIFQKPIEKLSSASYSVTGKWDDPEIKLQRIFDDDAEKASQPQLEPVVSNTPTVSPPSEN